MTPHGPSWSRKGSFSSPPLACPKKAVSSRYDEVTTVYSVTGASGAPKTHFHQRSIHGESVIDHSLQLVEQKEHEGSDRLVWKVIVATANSDVQEHLAKGKGPHVEPTRDPCSVRFILSKELVHVARFPFQVACKDVKAVRSNRRDYAHFIVAPLQGPLEIPFYLTT